MSVNKFEIKKTEFFIFLRFKIIIPAAILFLSSLLLVSCSIAKKSKAESSDIERKKVITVSAKKEKKANILTSFGTISYKSKHDISTIVEGSVKQLFVKEGDWVKKGQALAQLYNIQIETQKEQYENALESAKASLEVAEADLREQELSVESRLLSIEKQILFIKQQKIEYENALTNHENNRQLLVLGGITDFAFKSEELSLQSQKTQIEISEKELEISKLGFQDQDILNESFTIPENEKEKHKLLVKLNTKSAAAQVNSAKANVSNAEKNLQSVNRLIEELTVRSSVQGIVGIKNFEEGEFVAENRCIFTILDTASVYAVFSIQEKEIEKYTSKSRVTITIPSIDRSIESVISELSPYADPQSGNFTVKVLINNPSLKIKPGLFVKSTIVQDNADTFIVVPETAIVKENNGKNTVYLVKNNIVVFQNVEIDSMEDGKAWISEGLKEGALVIDKPSPFLKEGENVIID